MIGNILEAIGYGLFLAVLVGPIFMSLVDTSIKYGRKSGIILASGIWISDFVIVAILLAFTDLPKYELPRQWAKGLALTAGIIFAVMGIARIIHWRKKQDDDTSINPRKRSLVLKGLAINTINPFTMVFWTTLMAGQAVIKQKQSYALMAFFGALLFTIVVTDALKVLLSDKLGKWLHSGQIKYLNLTTGLVFIISGGYIVYRFLLS